MTNVSREHGGRRKAGDKRQPEPVRLELPPLPISVPSFLASPNSTAERLLDAALDLFAGKGYEAASMDDIADLVGITKGSLYHYVTGKQDLLSAVFILAFSNHTRVASAVNEAQVSGLDAIRYFVTSYIDINLVDVRPPLVLERDWGSLAAIERQHWNNSTQRQLDFLHHTLADALRRGELGSHIHPGLTAMATYGMLTWAPLWYRPGTSLERKQVGQAFADFILDGLRPRPTLRIPGETRETRPR